MLRSYILIWLAGCALLAATADDQSPASTEPQRVLVMSTGRVVHGEVTETAGGYRVATPNGPFILPYNQVMCTAATLREAHQRLQQVFTPPSASNHVILSRWCMENRLYDLAMDEVQAALQLEPGRTEARQLLWQLEQILSPAPTVAATEHEDRFTWDHFTSPPVAAPGGLTRETTNEFVRRVQPLLLNSCANARCHGSPQATFHLDFVPSSGIGGQNITTANIESVFKFIDIDQPRESRLFSALIDPAIREHQQVLQGPRGRERLDAIADWIAQGSLERGGKPAVITDPLIQTASAVTTSDMNALNLASATPDQQMSPPERHAPLTLDNAPPISIEPLSGDVTDAPPQAEAQEIVTPTPTQPPTLFATPAADAFDPSAFNRRVHSRP